MEYEPSEYYYYDSDILYITYSKNQINVDDTEENLTVNVQEGKDVFYELNIENSGGYILHLTAQSFIQYRIYNENFDTVLSTYGGQEVSRFLSLEAGTYYLTVYYELYIGIAPLNVSVEPHTHSFGNYTYKNARSHQRVCNECNTIQTEGHFVYADEIVDGRYATCGGCNRQLDLTVDLPTIIMSITQVSVNGSYILPNGIVVLVDEDVEAYLAGTLQFYHPADLPVTE